MRRKLKRPNISTRIQEYSRSINDLPHHVLAQIIIECFRGNGLTPSLVAKHWYRVIKSLSYQGILNDMNFPSLCYPHKLNHYQHLTVEAMIESECPAVISNENYIQQEQQKTRLTNLLVGYNSDAGRTAIVLYHYLVTRTPGSISIIITSTSSIGEWKNEIDKYFGNSVVVAFFYGGERQYWREKLNKKAPGVEENIELVVTTPSTISEEKLGVGNKYWDICSVGFERIYIDEKILTNMSRTAVDRPIKDLIYTKYRWVLATKDEQNDSTFYTHKVVIQRYKIESKNEIDRFKTKVSDYIDLIDYPKTETFEQYLQSKNILKAEEPGAPVGTLDYTTIENYFSEELLFEMVGKTGKVKRLIWLINELFFNKERAIIFCPPSVIEQLYQSLRAPGVFITVIDMKCDPMKRTSRIKQFSMSSPPSLILTTHRISALGVNIRTANNVIHIYPPPRLIHYSECFDRINRIGHETEVVKVHYLHSSKTEKKLSTLLRRRLVTFTTTKRITHD